MSKKLKTNLINKNKTRKNNKSLDDTTKLSNDQINKICKKYQITYKSFEKDVVFKTRKKTFANQIAKSVWKMKVFETRKKREKSKIANISQIIMKMNVFQSSQDQKYVMKIVKNSFETNIKKNVQSL